MRIVIAGAGEVGSHLAKMLGESDHDITVIDNDPKLLENVTNISDVVAIEGDCTTFATLKKASVRKADLFIAVNREESPNIISAMLAKQLGARKTIARIDNNEYLEPNNKEVFINMGIDYLFYPEKVAALEVVNLLVNRYIDPEFKVPLYEDTVMEGWPYFSAAINVTRNRRLGNWREKDMIKEPLPSGISDGAWLLFKDQGA